MDRGQVSNPMFALLIALMWPVLFAAAIFYGSETGDWYLLGLWAAVTAFGLGMGALMRHSSTEPRESQANLSEFQREKEL